MKFLLDIFCLVLTIVQLAMWSHFYVSTDIYICIFIYPYIWYRYCLQSFHCLRCLHCSRGLCCLYYLPIFTYIFTIHVCGQVMFSVVSVCLSACLSVYISVQAITFEPLHIDTSFLVYRYITTISRSYLTIKVIGLRSRSYEKNDNFTYFNMLILCILLKIINKV